MEKLSALQTAKLLNVSIEKLSILEKQGVIHSNLNSQGARVYSSLEIEKIKLKRGLTIAEEAERVGSGIQREIVSYVNLHRRLFLLIGSVLLGYYTLMVAIAISFAVSPRLTSDFFGYYYRFNSQKELQVSTSLVKGKSVLAAAVGPAEAPYDTVVLADILRPIASVSLVVVKAIDEEKYLEIVSNPILVPGFPQTGSASLAGENGADGEDGADGNDGAPGLDGLTGSIGPSGAIGATGSNGADGVSVADILTSVGGIIIRDGTNTTIQLGAGLDGQVLTITSGIPTWENSSGGSAFSSLSSGTNTLAAMIVGSGGSLGFSGTGVINASQLLGGTWAIPGAIGSTTPNTGAFTTLSSTGASLIGQGTGVVTLNSSGALNLTGASASTWTLANVVDSLNFDSDTLSIDALNNRIGIGTTSPTQALELTGNVYINSLGTGLGIISRGATTNFGGIQLATAGVNKWTLGTRNDSTEDFHFFDEVLGSDVMTLTTNSGRVGIGATSPSYRLSVVGTQSSGNIASFSNFDTSSSASKSVLRLNIGTATGTILTRFMQFYAGVTTEAGSGTGVGNIRLNNTGLTYASGNADLAEWTDVTDTPVAGDIIAVLPTGNQKAITGDLVLGVVTDTAAFIGNEIGDLTGKVVVGMLGRVDTKVSNENGDIAIGDPITASSVAGVGMKQTKAGPTIGKALETKTGAVVERVTVQVIPGWYDPDPLLTSSSFSILGANVLDLNSEVVTRVGGFQDIFAGDISIADELTLTTGTLSLTATSGVLALSGLSSSSINTGTNTLTVTSSNFNTTGTGINSTAIGVTTASTGSFTSLASTGTTNLGSGTGTVSVNSSGTTNIQVAGVGTTGNIQIGAGGAGSATPDLLVMDIKDTAGDPTGTNGAMYYNSNTNKFRCFENSAWKDCDAVGSDLQYVTSYKIDDTFTNITSSVTTLTTVSITPSTVTGDVMVRAGVTFMSSNNTTQPFTIAIRQTDCTGTILETTTFSIAADAGADQDQHLDLNYVAVDPGASSQTYAFCASSSAGDTDVTDWNMSAIVIDTGADLAEIYTTNDASIEVGDVVSIDPTLITGMKKSQIAYDRSVLGIVSTKPGLVIGGVDNEGVSAMPVALVGRVPAKVSTQNGAIKAGDYLTSSTISGVAMKATKSGAIIGTAMASYDSDGIGQILVFVKNGSSMGNDFDGEDSDVVTLTRFLSQSSYSEDISNLDDIGVSISSYSPENVSAVETNLIAIMTKIISELFKNTVEFFGNVIVHGDVAFLGRPQFDKDTAGHALIKTGENEISLKFQKEYERVPVVNASVNLKDNINFDEIPKFAIYDLSTKGFKIRLSKATAFDLDFSWIALSANEESIPASNTSDMTEDVIPTPSATPSEIPPETLEIPSPTPSLGEEKSSTETELVSPSPDPI